MLTFRLLPIPVVQKWDTVSDVTLNVQNRIDVSQRDEWKKCFVANAVRRRAVH